MRPLKPLVSLVVVVTSLTYLAWYAKWVLWYAKYHGGLQLFTLSCVAFTPCKGIFIIGWMPAIGALAALALVGFSWLFGGEPNER